ncbi:MAG: hypothetical protein J0H40_16930 [Rhizobiales bacterium]|nr:hypothetical protein [Hyphomicrobiales bacterium]
MTAIGQVSDTTGRADFVSRGWGASSACTIGRFESDEDLATTEFSTLKANLDVAAAIGYEAAKIWIQRERLDAVIAFNGRMDATRGILEAAKDTGVRYISMERSWFGDGLQLLPDESCLGLRSISRLAAEWCDVPLTPVQARRAATIVAARFNRSNSKEWRAYNTSALHKEWPANGRYKVLLVPGSRSEVWGHPDRADGWQGRTQAYDALISHFDLKPQDIVLRAHPNWSERIGQRTGIRAEEYYRDWAQKRGVSFIPSNDRTSTLGLIEQADIVVVAGGSAAIEAGIIGKRIIALAPSEYQAAGFVESANNVVELSATRPIDSQPETVRFEEIARRTLRFCYTIAYRVPQYVDAVTCVSTTNYKYLEDTDPDRIIELIQTGILKADDASSAVDYVGENAILGLVSERRWFELTEAEPENRLMTRHHLMRRPLFRAFNSMRPWWPKGDL